MSENENNVAAAEATPAENVKQETRSRGAAVFFALFFGPLGISEAYLGRKKSAVTVLLLTIAAVAAAWYFKVITPDYKAIDLTSKWFQLFVIGMGAIWAYTFLCSMIVTLNPVVGDQTPAEAVEFQPDALEIKNSKLPVIIRLCVWIPAVVVLIGIVWASLCEVDIVVSARGKIITGQPTIVLKPYDRVFVKDVKVSVGDIVEKDQVLIEFEPKIYDADAARLENDRDTFKAQYERFSAEFEGKKYVLPSDATVYDKEQLEIYKQRQEYYNARIQSFDASIRYYNEAKKTKEVTLNSMREQYKVFKELCDQYERLQKSNAASWREYAQMTISRLEMEGNIAALLQSIQELKNQTEATVAQKEAFVQEWRNTISENMVTAKSKLKTADSQLLQVNQLRMYTELKAPCRAVVHEVAAFSENSGVREAEALITLIPIDGDLFVEAEVRPMDIARVRLGSEARIKLDAYPFQKYDTMSGEVVGISENTIQKDQRSLDPEASMTYYRTRLSYDSSTMNHLPENFRLIPGMEVQVEIMTGRRKIITYVTYPLIKALDTAIREP